MNLDENKYINVKINCNLKKIKQILDKHEFKCTKLLYNLDIYMILNSINIYDIQKVEDIDTYAIICDRNNEQKKIIFKHKAELYGCIRGVESTKELLCKLGYKELMYINKDIYAYETEDICFLINDIKNQGIFLEVKVNKKYQTIEEILQLLNKLRIPFDNKNLNVNNETLGLNIRKEGYN